MNHSESIRLDSSRCDYRGFWKISDMLLAFQELAGKHSAYLGCGRNDLYEKYGLVWVVTRYQVNIHHMPLYDEQVRLNTGTFPARRTFYPRSFQVLDKDGIPAVSAYSYWALCNVENRKMVFSEQIASLIPDMTDSLQPPDCIRLFPDPQAEDTVLHRTACYSDLDINTHVNNARYLDWLCDVLGTKTLSEKYICSFIIDYQREIRKDQSVTLYYRTDENCFFLSGEVSQLSAFRIGGHLKPLCSMRRNES